MSATSTIVKILYFIAGLAVAMLLFVAYGMFTQQSTFFYTSEIGSSQDIEQSPATEKEIEQIQSQLESLVSQNTGGEYSQQEIRQIMQLVSDLDSAASGGVAAPTPDEIDARLREATAVLPNPTPLGEDAIDGGGAQLPSPEDIEQMLQEQN